jgi:hypothetical protein
MKTENKDGYILLPTGENKNCFGAALKKDGTEQPCREKQKNDPVMRDIVWM